MYNVETTSANHILIQIALSLHKCGSGFVATLTMYDMVEDLERRDIVSLYIYF